MKKRCDHRGNPVRAGPYEILAGGLEYFDGTELPDVDLVIPLTRGYGFLGLSEDQRVLELILEDYGGVPKDWEERLREDVIPELEVGNSILTFCVGSHGRTGCFLASLIALLESSEETPDPIFAVRERHCSLAVESEAQAEAIFALRGEVLPESYHGMFRC